MGLTLEDHLAMLSGFERNGFRCTGRQLSTENPIRLDWYSDEHLRRFRLWAFEITHGGGGATVRAADEFRVQITNGPASMASFDRDGATDLLLGYSRDREVIVAYDRGWLEAWTQKRESLGARSSPSVQVKESDMEAGRAKGIHHLKKSAQIGDGNIVTLRPEFLPAYLLNHDNVLRGLMTAGQAEAATPRPNRLTVLDYCRSQGFPFDPDLVAQYVAAIQAKPFVILAGVSGTGKSKLAELVAEFYSLTSVKGIAKSSATAPTPGDRYVFEGNHQPDRTRFALVPVRPDWIDGQAIVGFVNPITDTYESTQSLELLLRADRALKTSPTRASAHRYFLLLDEMNLARVEHYFSDWLACAESRRLGTDGITIIQQPVPLYRAKAIMETAVQGPDGTSEAAKVPQSLELPTNVIVTGTVNVDETTYGLSPKVLDRAMVLEFDDVDLERLRDVSQSEPTSGYRFPRTLRPFSLASSADYGKLPAEAHELLKRVNAILEDARLHFGYRTANEMALFMSIYNDILPPDPEDTRWLRALDTGILVKVLPRLSGNRARLEQPLSNLCAFLRDFSAASDGTREFNPKSDAKLPKSYRRAIEMLRALQGFGFVSFFK